MAADQASSTYRFRDCELDLGAYELRRQGRPVRLERQPMDLLILLVERRRQLVTRAEIVARLWPKDVFVDVDTGVNTAVRKIRLALGDSPEVPAFVETVPGKGYRFIAAVDVPPAFGRDAIEPPIEPLTPPPAPAPVGSRVGRRAVALGLLAILVVVGVAAWARLHGGAASRVTLAVLPFENIGRDPERDYLADGLAEDTIASVGQVDPERISVIGRTSVMQYKGTTKSLGDIGRELDVDYVVESSIQGESGQVRITSKLIRTRDQVQVWAASYDREPTSVLALQRELSTAIAEQIRLRLSPARLDAMALRKTRNADAYDLYLRGRNFASLRTPKATERAVEYYRRATALDPDYALAWSGLAETYSASPMNGDARPSDVIARARESAAQAVRAAPDLAEAQTTLGVLKFHLDWDWPAAEAALRRAITLDPNYSRPYLMLGHLLSQTGRQGEGSALMHRARQLEPLSALNHALSSQVAFQGRDYAGSREHARRAVVVDPEFWIGHMMLGQAYMQLGENDLAIQALTSAARFSGPNSKALAFRGYLLARSGRPAEAREVLKALEAAARDRYVPPYAFALVHAGLGERDAVFTWLDRAYEARDVHLVFLPVDVKWDPYRADPRFEALLARCDFMRRRVATSSASGVDMAPPRLYQRGTLSIPARP